MQAIVLYYLDYLVIHLSRNGNKDDIIAFLIERNLPVDEIGANQLADRILESPPNQGYGAHGHASIAMKNS